jgi:hypothetical protein
VTAILILNAQNNSLEQTNAHHGVLWDGSLKATFSARDTGARERDATSGAAQGVGVCAYCDLGAPFEDAEEGVQKAR